MVKMRRFHGKTVVSYAIFGIGVLMFYKYFVQNDDRSHRQKESDPFRDKTEHHPKILQNNQEYGKVLEGEKEPERLDVPPINNNKHKDEKIDVGDIPKDLHPDPDDVKNQQKSKKFVKEQMGKIVKNKEDGQKKKPKVFLEDGVDWEVEEEMKKRRAAFLKTLKENATEEGKHEEDNIPRGMTHLAFVTAGSHSTYMSTLQFIFSIQFFYPYNQIVVYDIGLTSYEKKYINSLCNAEVLSLWLQFWPEELYRLRQRVWRPLLLQFSFNRFTHFVYLEPGRYIYRDVLQDYLQQSQKHGIVVGGHQMKYSSIVVTNPHMFGFFMIDEKNLKRTPHFEFTLLLVHSTSKVNKHLMRYLTACALEEYCISPPGSKSDCGFNYAVSREYMNCHRYDESALNVILNVWFRYRAKEFLMRDGITKSSDGRDMSDNLRVCNDKNKDEV